MEISKIEVSEIIGVSENTLYKDFKKCIDKLNNNNIRYEGKGKNRKFYKEETESREEYAYEIFKQLAYNVWGFDRQVDIDKLLHYMSVVLTTQDNKSSYSALSSGRIAVIVGVDKNTISRYKHNLTSNQIFKPKHLSKTVTFASYNETDRPTLTSKLIAHPCNHLNKKDQDSEFDNFRYQVKVVVGETVKQEYIEKVIVDNDLYESYLHACRLVANTPNLTVKDDYQRVKEMVNSNKHLLNITAKDKYIAFSEFKRELGLSKMWQVSKTEYRHDIMNNEVLLDVIVNAFKFKYPDSKLNKILSKYCIN